MNRSTIEQTLHHAPAVKTPAALRQQLREGIELPRNIAPPRESVRSRWSWIPALGFTLWFLGCMVVLGVQSNWFGELKPSSKPSELTGTEARVIAPDNSSSELAQLEKDIADTERLRAEVQRLRAELAELAKLRERNNALRDELAQRNVSNSSASPQQDFFATAYDRAVRARCINNIKQVCLAARIWANDNKDVLPDRVTLEASLNRGNSNISLQCPAEPSAVVEVLSPGASESRPEVVYIRCAKHNCAGLVDGSAHMLDDSTKQVVQRDGQWVLQRSK